jgi:glutaconate CoA-transferase subunit B
MEYTKQEFMAIVTGREIKDGELIILGVGLSMLAGYFAQYNHAPNLMPFTEGGVYGSTPVGGLPGASSATASAPTPPPSPTPLTRWAFWLPRAVADNAVIGAAQVDKFGNVNTTGIWGDNAPWKIGKYVPPKVRLNGSGGANDIAVGAKRYLIMASHESRAASWKRWTISPARAIWMAATHVKRPVSWAAGPRLSSPPWASCGPIPRPRNSSWTPISPSPRGGSKGKHRLGFESIG